MSEIHQLVLVRGLARESRHWGSFAADLRAAYQKKQDPQQDPPCEVRIETIDLPGCGRHSEMSSPVSIDAITEFARQKLAEIFRYEAEQGIAPATHRRLIAMSLGGMVAANWLSRFPTDFHSAVLINSSFSGLSEFYERLRFDSWWRLPKILSAHDVRKREAEILEWISNRADRRAEVLEAWTAIQLSRPVTHLNFALQLFAAGQFKAPKDIRVPLLVLASKCDRMVNPACSEAISRSFGAKILYHPTAGHDLPLDAGPWTASMISEWGDSCLKSV